MNQPPIPHPSAHTCPNCGTPVEGNISICPRCGALIRPTQSGGNSGCWIVFLQIVLALVAVTFGLAGACFVILGGSDMQGGGSGSGGIFNGLIGVGLAGLAIAALCIWGIFALVKRSK